MRAPRLPSRAADAWECSFVFDAARAVRSVSSRGGLVVACGDELHVVRPGAQSMSSRRAPFEVGPLVAVAAEPRAPFRYAIASRDHVAVFLRGQAGRDGDQVVRLRSAEGGPCATHLAWGRAEGESVLYVRWDDGEIVRTKKDMSGVDTTDLPPMDAIAGDAEGVLAMVSFAGPEPRAFVTADGETLAWRALPPGLSIGAAQRVHLAVAEMAVAFAVDRGGAFVSRADEAPFVAAEHLSSAGALDFEGASSDAALFGADGTTIVRIDAAGEGVRVAEFGGDAGVAPEVTALSWDAPRRTLWGASPQMGLVTCVAPEAKGTKKLVMS